MGALLQRLAGKVIMAVLGFGLWFGYATMCSSGTDGSHETLATLPSVVFGGGGGRLEIDVQLNQPGQMSASFEPVDENAEATTIATDMPLAPGIHHFEVDVARETYGYFEISVPEAKVGATLAWQVSLDGETLATEELELEKPLAPGYAFFVQLEFDEISELRVYARR